MKSEHSKKPAVVDAPTREGDIDLEGFLDLDPDSGSAPDADDRAAERAAAMVAALRPSAFVVHEAMRAALLRTTAVGAGDRSRRLLVLVRVPSLKWQEPVRQAAEAVLATERASFDRTTVHGIEAEGSRKDATADLDYVLVALHDHDVIVLEEEDAHVAEPLRLMADLQFAVPRPDPALLSEMLRRRFGGDAQSWPEDLDAGALPPALIDLILGRAGSPVEAVRWIGAAATPPPSSEARVSAPEFRTLRGYGAAKEWGLRLIEDLRAYAAGRIAWDDVDKGMLLVGPPGTGKTTFAASLAAAAGVQFVATSYSAWQAEKSGHLGDVTRAIRRTFAEAVRKAPSIVFVDEIDSFPSRDTEKSYDTWWRAVVNCLLECLDGSLARDGVIVLAACNRHEGLDPALVRPGRLDRVVRIGLPDADDLAAILRSHLGSGSDGDGIEAVALSLAGSASGADAARIARDARRLARAAGRGPNAADVAQVALPTDDRPHPVKWRTAVHEAGHAVAALVMGNALDAVSIVRRGHAGGTAVFEGGFGEQLLVDFQRFVVVQLAGRAAEEVLLGRPSAGAGGPDGSDLASATSLLGHLEAGFGLGSSLSTGDVLDPREVEARMRRLYAEALMLVVRHRSDVLALADLLMEHLVLGRDALRVFAESRGIVPD